MLSLLKYGVKVIRWAVDELINLERQRHNTAKLFLRKERDFEVDSLECESNIKSEENKVASHLVI